MTSNTDAAQLAETFAESKCPTKVISVSSNKDILFNRRTHKITEIVFNTIDILSC